MIVDSDTRFETLLARVLDLACDTKTYPLETRIRDVFEGGLSDADIVSLTAGSMEAASLISAKRSLTIRNLHQVLDRSSFYEKFVRFFAWKVYFGRVTHFCHVEKTAGSSVKSAFRNSDLCHFIDTTPARVRDVPEGFRLLEMHRVLGEWIVNPRKWLVLGGHMGLPALRSMVGPVRQYDCFSVVRDPIDLHISNARYHLKVRAQRDSEHRGEREDLSVDEIRRVFREERYTRLYSEIYHKYWGGYGFSTMETLDVMASSNVRLVRLEDLDSYLGGLGIYHLPHDNSSGPAVDRQLVRSQLAGEVESNLVLRDRNLLALASEPDRQTLWWRSQGTCEERS